jgi:hypothetical protein
VSGLVAGLITVTLNATDAADAGTTSVATGVTLPGGCVGTVPVTCNVWDTTDTTGPARPTPPRVSKIRVGVNATNDDGPEAFDDPTFDYGIRGGMTARARAAARKM